MNFIGELHGAQVEIKPLDPQLEDALDLIIETTRKMTPDTPVEVLRQATIALMCMLRGENIPNRDGRRTVWDQVSPGHATPEFIKAVADIAIQLGKENAREDH